MPPPSAVVSEGVSTLPSSMFLSSTVKVAELIVVVVPPTVRSPVNVSAAPLIVPVNVGDAFLAKPESTKAVVAICVVLVSSAAVGAAGVPVKVGHAFLAKPESTKAVVAICVEFVPSAAVGAAGVPVKVGLAVAAFAAKDRTETD